MPVKKDGQILGLIATRRERPDPRLRYDPDKIQLEIDAHEANAMEFDHRAAFERKKAVEKRQLKKEVLELRIKGEPKEEVIASTFEDPALND
jgi:hypothetical protein